MGWAARKKHNSKRETKDSEIARGYRLKHVPSMYAAGEDFTDARGRKYAVRRDGSLQRLGLEKKR